MRYFSYLQQMHLIGLFALSTSLFDGRKPAQATRCLNAHFVSLVQPGSQAMGGAARCACWLEAYFHEIKQSSSAIAVITRMT